MGVKYMEKAVLRLYVGLLEKELAVARVQLAQVCVHDGGDVDESALVRTFQANTDARSSRYRSTGARTPGAGRYTTSVSAGRSRAASPLPRTNLGGYGYSSLDTGAPRRVDASQRLNTDISAGAITPPAAALSPAYGHTAREQHQQDANNDSPAVHTPGAVPSAEDAAAGVSPV